MYGDEEAGIPPEELYDGEDAEEAFGWAKRVAELVLRLYREVSGEQLFLQL